MENKNIVKIGLTTGRLNKRVIIQNELFYFLKGKEKKLKPNEPEILIEKCNNNKDYYNLLVGEEYCLRAIVRTKGKDFYGTALLSVEPDEVKIKKWKGNFCPKFSI